MTCNHALGNNDLLKCKIDYRRQFEQVLQVTIKQYGTTYQTKLNIILFERNRFPLFYCFWRDHTSSFRMIMQITEGEKEWKLMFVFGEIWSYH